MLAVVTNNVDVVLLPGVPLIVLRLHGSVGLHDGVGYEPVGGNLPLPQVRALNPDPAAVEEAQHLIPHAVQVLIRARCEIVEPYGREVAVVRNIGVRNAAVELDGASDIDLIADRTLDFRVGLREIHPVGAGKLEVVFRGDAEISRLAESPQVSETVLCSLIACGKVQDLAATQC